MTLPNRSRRKLYLCFLVVISPLNLSHSIAGAVEQPIAEKVDDSESLTFDSDFLSLGKEGAENEKHVDLSYFAHKGGMAPGQYAVQVKVNGKMVDEGRIVTFKSMAGHPGKLYACVSAEQLSSWWGIKTVKANSVSTPENEPAEVSGESTETRNGISTDKFDEKEPGPDKARQSEEDQNERSSQTETTCSAGGITAMVPYSQETFDFNNHLLSLTIPQAYLGASSRLRTPPQLWESGIPAVLMNYNYNGSQQKNRTGNNRSDFLNINGQLNILNWRLRSDLTGHSQQDRGTEWNMSQAYAQREFARWGGGQLTVGNTASSGGGVDSVSFLGAKVDSDDGMFDPAFISYTPAITGIADSPSVITVRQYGKVIYQQNVPQGPYSLTDFNRTGSGDVNVEIREADGRVRHFTLAQANSGVLIPQGSTSYSASAGKAANSQGYVDDRFIQAGGSYGIQANTTLTGGTLLSKDYQALSVGTGFYAGVLGAFSYTLQGNRADLSVIPGLEGNVMGLTHAMGWSRVFGSTSLGVSYSLNQTPAARNYSQMLSLRPRKIDEPDEKASASKDSLGISLSQSMGRWGSLALNGIRSTSWGSNQVQQNITLGYNTSLQDVSIGLALGYSTVYGHDAVEKHTEDHSRQDQNHHSDRSVSLTVSVPLGKWLGTSHLSNANYSYTRSNDTISQQTGVSGTAMEGALSYSVAQSLAGNRSGSTSLGYGGRYGSLSGGYSYGGGASSLSYGMSGGAALHSHGMTLGKPLSLSGGNALVEIPDAAGINVGNATTDSRGYALISGLTPYDRNPLSVDMSELPGNMELDVSSKSVIPTRGALVSVPFKNHKGYRLLLNLQHKGTSVPFGASALLKQETPDSQPLVGIVGDEGQVYLSGMPEKGTVKVSWGESLAEQCIATYTLPPKADMDKLHTISAQCR